uniref:Uncharacterized protein n=1 Tax=Rhizophora mucronata TaxID=61149 RepID=A0A2P2PDH5_RHIMU
MHHVQTEMCNRLNSSALDHKYDKMQ